MRSFVEVPLSLGPKTTFLIPGNPATITSDPVFVALIIAVASLGVAIIVLLMQRAKPVRKGDKSRSRSSMQTPKPPQPLEQGEIPPRPEPRSTKPSVRKRSRRVLPPREEAILAEDAGDFARAAAVWMQRGNRIAQFRALQRAGDQAGMARLEIALGWPDQAVPKLEALLSERNDDIDTRLLLFHAYLDLGNQDKASALAYDAISAKNESSLAAGHLTQFALGFEAVGERDAALRFYDEASKRPDAPEDVEVRVLYLEEMNRLQDPPETTSGEFSSRGVLELAFGKSSDKTKSSSPSPEEMLERELSSAAGETTPAEPPRAEKPTRSLMPLLSGHEVIVGHLALGGERGANGLSVRSVASLASRYKLKRLTGEARNTALFEAVDRLLDCPVAIKLCHVSMSESDFDLLRDRLRVIASLNHPNLTKTTFVDRYGNVVRVVTEYHSGGNLESMLARMERIGLPLMLRLMMQVASGIHAGHTHGVIHGDLRPRNVMIGHDQLIKVVDYAMAPWPVRRLKPDDSRGRDALQMFPSEEIQSDIRRFANLLDYVLERTVVSSVLAGTFEDGDPLEELREVGKRAREGAFSSLTPIQSIFQQVLEEIQPMGRSD